MQSAKNFQTGPMEKEFHSAYENQAYQRSVNLATKSHATVAIESP